jgi:hypothetical protein
MKSSTMILLAAYAALAAGIAAWIVTVVLAVDVLG